MNPKTLQYLMGHSDVSVTLVVVAMSELMFAQKNMFIMIAVSH